MNQLAFLALVIVLGGTASCCRYKRCCPAYWNDEIAAVQLEKKDFKKHYR